jgi:two-component system OmpR family response regulator
MAILLIEDDAVLADGLVHALGQSGYRVAPAATAAAAEKRLQTQNFDLIVLDLGLPDKDGLELLQNLRRQKTCVPILVLTARDSVQDRIEGIKQGADDYLVKPFELSELEARIHALLRRCYGGFGNETAVGPLTFDSQRRQVSVNGEPLALSLREYSVLELLLVQAGKVVSKEKIGQRLSFEGAAQTDNAIDIYIHRLRKHIEPYGIAIRTVRGLGYLLETAADDQ